MRRKPPSLHSLAPRSHRCLYKSVVVISGDVMACREGGLRSE